MPKKLEFSVVKNNIESKGHTLLSDIYINGHTPIKYICGDCGEEAYQEYSQLMINIGHGCKIGKKIVKIHRYICKYCENTFISRRRKKVFCSKKCAIDWQLYTPEGIEQRKINGSKGGKMASKVKRSKNEIYFYELCSKYLNCQVLPNHSMFDGYDADIVIPDLKIAIEWNGKWHYAQVHKFHDFERTQRNDKKKKAMIEKSQYDLYIIKDMGGYNKKFVEQFELFKEYIKSR